MNAIEWINSNEYNFEWIQSNDNRIKWIKSNAQWLNILWDDHAQAQRCHLLHMWLLICFVICWKWDLIACPTVCMRQCMYICNLQTVRQTVIHARWLESYGIHSCYIHSCSSYWFNPRLSCIICPMLQECSHQKTYKSTGLQQLTCLASIWREPPISVHAYIHTYT